jgi:hypothetical protein
MGWGWDDVLLAPVTGGLYSAGKAAYNANNPDRSGTRSGYELRQDARRIEDSNTFARQPGESDEDYRARYYGYQQQLYDQNAPAPVYGGSRLAQQTYRGAADDMRKSGQVTSDLGAGYVMGAIGDAGAVAANGRDMYGAGVDAMQFGARGYQADRGANVQTRNALAGIGAASTQQYGEDRMAQQAALRQQYAAATGAAPSQAEQLLRANQAAQQRAAMAQAAGLRGGNSLAGLRAAQATGTQSALDAGNQAAALRAQEMAAARGAFAAQANQMAGGSAAREASGYGAAGQLGTTMASQNLGMLGMGQNIAATGLGAQQFGASAALQGGATLADIGAGTRNAGLGWMSDQERISLGSQFGYDQIEAARRNQDEQNKWAAIGTGIGAAGGVLGSLL